MPPPPLKRGRLSRFLSSLRPPSRPGPLPVQTGFPTSLADLLVNNHGRLLLTNPKRRHRCPSPPSPSPTTPHVAAAVDPTPPLQIKEQSVLEDEVAVAVRLRPELLAVGVATAALVMVLIWSRWFVAALTVASLTLLWIEPVRSNSVTSRRRRTPAAAAAAKLPDLRGRGEVSPIREVESTTNSTERKGKRRWLKKIIVKKNKKQPPAPAAKEKDFPVVVSGEVEQPDAGEVISNAVAEEQQQELPPPAIGRRGGALAPLAAVVLIGLVGGKLPAVALTLLFTVLFSSVERREEIDEKVMN
uniref:Uncharacterized protein n=1 Tax=Leersia perrieri TaxID=77586 RepID=A0A0D9Y1N9_9ORYZ